ncbi:hypothetical protein M378DRAFT_17521, partial [Amanita muscaria Koide BX008]
HFYTDREPSDLPRVAVKFNGEIYLYEREILYRPDAKVFTERGTGLVLTDNIWNIPKNVTKEDLLLHVPFDKKERLAHLIDQRNQQLSAERSKTQSPRNASAPLRPSKPYSRPSPQEPVASGSSQIQRQRSRKTESPEKSRTSSRQQSPEPRRETPPPQRSPTPPGNPPDDPLTMAAAANNPSKFTFPAPEAFTGEKTRARSWITECETYFTQPGVRLGIPDDRTQVFFCLIKMSGKADFWKCVKLEEYTKEGGTWPTWAVFKTAFIEAFGGDDPKTKALTKLMTMERRRMKNFELYSHLTMLDNLFNESGMTQEDQKIIWLQKTIPNEYFKNIMFDDFDTYASLVTKLKKINKGVERKTFFNVAGIGGGTSNTKDEFAMDIRPVTNVDEKDIGLQTVSLKPKRDKEVSNLKEICGLLTATLRE